LQHGPLGGTHIEVPDPPPELVQPEDLNPDDEELAPVGEGREYPATRFKHPYRFVGYTNISTDAGETQIVVYVYAPDLA
jgi:hypothetical protein